VPAPLRRPGMRVAAVHKAGRAFMRTTMARLP
jgi:hypothetical protein